MKNAVWIVAFATVLTACHPDNPPLSGASKPATPAAVEKPGPLTFETSFGFFKSESTAEQQRFDQNTITSFFTAKGSNGRSIENLTVNDIGVTENRINVSPFTIEIADRTEIQDTVEIALVIDITRSMVPLIAEAKKALKAFVSSPQAENLHLRLCLSTFGDYTVKKCSSFFDIKPKEAGAVQRRDFLSALSRIEAYRGSDDPGHNDHDENPMGALIDMSKAPWSKGQKFVILVTDAGFLYSPDNQGVIGNRAPTMKQVNDAISESGMKVYAVTRTKHQQTFGKLDKNCSWIDQAARTQSCVWDGYNTPFQGEKSIVETSNGAYFDFDAVLRGEVQFSSILEKIVRDVSITYKLTYVVDKVQGLNPTLPINSRNVQISLKDQGRGTIAKQSTQSSMPTGRAQEKQEFNVSENAIDGSSLTVTMDGRPLSKDEYSVSKGTVRFKAAPPQGSKMVFSYFHENPDLNLKLEPISMRGSLTAKNTKVYLNGVETRDGDALFSKDVSGNTSVGFSKNIMAANDPYQIRRNQRLDVKIVGNAE
jgi:hypothetical protein